jgi:hypothetical protein
MAATGILIDAGCTEAEVLALRAKVKAELLAGGSRVTEWRTNNSSASLAWSLTPVAMMDECRYALMILNPTTYGVYNNSKFGRYGFNTGSEVVS